MTLSVAHRFVRVRRASVVRRLRIRFDVGEVNGTVGELHVVFHELVGAVGWGGSWASR